MQVLLHDSFLQGLVEEREKALPPQTTPAEPADGDNIHTKVVPHGLCSFLAPMLDIAIANDPNLGWRKKTIVRYVSYYREKNNNNKKKLHH